MDSATYPGRIQHLHRELGIPADYAQLRALELQPEISAELLVTIARNELGKPIQLLAEVAAPWRRMQAAALSSCEVVLQPLSGFRSVERQVEIIRGKLLLGESITDILLSLAAPGYSEHHTGRALDIGSDESPPLEESFADTKAFAWLQLHAHEYGFTLSYPPQNRHGFVYEPWHWLWKNNLTTPA